MTKWLDDGQLNYTNNHIKNFYRMFVTINELKVPVVTFIDGICFGGGAGVALLARFPVVTERAVIAMPEVHLGHYPDAGASYFFGRQHGPIGLFLALTGTRLIGSDIAKIGLTKYLINSSSLEQLEERLFELDEPDFDNVGDEISSFRSKIEVDESNLNIELIRKTFVGDSVLQIMTNLKEDGSLWSLKQLALMAKACPMSLKVAYYLNTMAFKNKLDVKQCLVNEYSVFKNLYENEQVRKNFIDGVRTLLIEKKAVDAWVPATLTDISDDDVHLIVTNTHYLTAGS